MASSLAAPVVVHGPAHTGFEASAWVAERTGLPAEALQPRSLDTLVDGWSSGLPCAGVAVDAPGDGGQLLVLGDALLDGQAIRDGRVSVGPGAHLLVTPAGREVRLGLTAPIGVVLPEGAGPDQVLAWSRTREAAPRLAWLLEVVLPDAEVFVVDEDVTRLRHAGLDRVAPTPAPHPPRLTRRPVLLTGVALGLGGAATAFLGHRLGRVAADDARATWRGTDAFHDARDRYQRARTTWAVGLAMAGTGGVVAAASLALPPPHPR